MAAPEPGAALDTLVASVVERARAGGDPRALVAEVDSLGAREMRATTAIIERATAHAHRRMFDLEGASPLADRARRLRAAAATPGQADAAVHAALRDLAGALDDHLAELHLEVARLDQDLLALEGQLAPLHGAATLAQRLDDALAGAFPSPARGSAALDVRAAVTRRRADVLAHLAVAEQSHAALTLSRTSLGTLLGSVATAAATARAARQATAPAALETLAQLRRREQELEKLARRA